MESQVKSPQQARVFMEGSEVCREYYKTGKITFGSSQLQPGQTGAIDPGHTDSHEVFFVSRGRVLMNCNGIYHDLMEGDAILIPPTVPHELTNIGQETALIIWSLAPSE